VHSFFSLPIAAAGDIPARSFMDWLAGLWAKLPTLKGIAWFFHVAANWSTFRDELELYRKQIKDRDEWRKTEAERHEEEKRRITQEAERRITQASGQLDKVGRIVRDAIALQAESSLRLAVHYKLNPIEWSLDSEDFSPELRREIEEWMIALGSPPPAPKTLGEIFNLSLPPPSQRQR
jgi:hypothetical protein